jgi:hypothetical protein
MAFRWNIMPATKTILQKDRAPTTADAVYDYPVIWVYTASNLAWLLKDGAIQVLPPTAGNITVIETSSTSLAELENEIDAIESDYMKKSIYDTDSNSVVDEAETIDGGSF